MRAVRRAVFFAWILGSCNSDPPVEQDCSGQPDFVVVVSALAAPLPADIVVHLEYSGGEEEYGPSAPGPHEVLFCNAADREGDRVDAGASAGQAGESAHSGGEGGEGGASGATPEALSCSIWTDGPARISIESESYPDAPTEHDLLPEKGLCTVTEEIELIPPDGGV